MDKRYQIFISSTFTDLKEERKAIIQSLLNSKYIPAGMEMFSASNDEQFKYIKKIIDNCDYYILIVGGRYGSINETTGLSFTEQEYDYAISNKIPVLSFLHSDLSSLPPEKCDSDMTLINSFRQKVSKNKMCKQWDVQSDLVVSVINSLAEETEENPQLGWTRGGTFDNAELLEQINSLRIEKEKLEKENTSLNAQINVFSSKVENLAEMEDTYTIKGKAREGYVNNITLTWEKIFSAVGPYLISAISFSVFESYLRKGINSSSSRSFYEFDENCVQTIKIQLNALGLIDAYPAKSVKGGYMEFISLTPKGKQYLMQIKTLKKPEET
jgi:hypothetical protein